MVTCTVACPYYRDCNSTTKIHEKCPQVEPTVRFEAYHLPKNVAIPYGRWDLSGGWQPNDKLNMTVMQQAEHNIKAGYLCVHLRTPSMCVGCNPCNSETQA